MGSGEASRAMQAVRAGKEMRKEDDSPFWDDFISLCANSDGLAELFDVSPEKVRSWPEKIRQQLEELEQHTAQSPSEKEDKEMLPTGDTGAVTTNQDPYLGEL